MVRLTTKLKTLSLIASLVCGGCMSTNASDMQMAVLNEADIETRKAIQRAISELLNGQTIALADNVFSVKSMIIVERKQHRDSSGALIDGRQPLEPADSFTLLTDTKNSCFVRHDQSGKKVNLPGLKCKPVI